MTNAHMTDAELDADRARNRAEGLCAAEQLTDHDRTVKLTNIPWMCSLEAGHDGDHEVWVTYTWPDTDRPDERACCHTWTNEPARRRITVEPWVTAHID